MKAQPMRVWDKVNKRMTYLPQLLPVIIPGGTCIGVFSTVPVATPLPAGGTIQTSLPNPLDYVIMFSTGKHDARGVSIFDGDIVDGAVIMDMGDDMPEFRVQKRGLVAWCDDLTGWAIQIPAADGHVEHYELDFEGSIKVGNVWETPQLLKEEPVVPVSRETPPEPPLAMA